MNPNTLKRLNAICNTSLIPMVYLPPNIEDMWDGEIEAKSDLEDSFDEDYMEGRK